MAKKNKKKKIKAKIRLQIPAGKATPAPPVGPALGQHGVPLMDFCKQFNAKTAEMGNDLIPVVITVFQDRSFDFRKLRKDLRLAPNRLRFTYPKSRKLLMASDTEIQNVLGWIKLQLN